MKRNKEEILNEANRIYGYIVGKELKEPEKDRIVSDSVSNFKEYVNPGWLTWRKSVSTDYAFVEWEDGGACFWDTHGTRFIDCLGGYGVYLLGHRHPKVREAVQAQLNRYALHSQELVDPLRGYLAELFSAIAPGDLKYSFFTNGGAEANEMALKLARLATGKTFIISTVNAFHGKSMGALSVTGRNVYREPYIPLIQGVQHVEYGSADAAEAAIHNLIAIGETVAGMIVEPIQGEAGIIVPPDDYLPRLREICDRYKVLLIFDEIQTGMGRTGKLWGCDNWNVAPDIMSVGKAFGGGVMPIAGIIAREELWGRIIENPWILGSPTFGGNAVVCAAAIAAIKVTLEEEIPKIAYEKGAYIMERLKAYKNKHGIITDVRGKGLLIGMEFESNKIGAAISKGLFKNHILIGATLNNPKTFRIEPPAVISYEEINIVLSALEDVINEVKRQ